MNKNEYLNKRKTLMDQVREAKEKGDADTMNNLMDQVDQLDDSYRNEAIAAANNRAKLLDQTGAPSMGSLSQNITGSTGERVNTQNMEQRSREDVLGSEEYRSAFLHKMQGRALTAEENKTMMMVAPVNMTSAAISAPAVIPTTTVRKIYGKLKESPLLDAINILHIPGNVEIPLSGTVNDAKWEAMEADSTPGSDTVTAVSLAAYKLIKTVKITADLAAMAIDEFEDWIVEALGKKMRSALDAAVISGDGSSKPTGLLHSGSITNAKTYTQGGGKMKYAELLAIIAALPSQYRPYAKFVMGSDVFFGEILAMTDVGGRPVVVADPQAAAQYRILGYPVILDDNMTATKGVFGDLREGYTLNFGSDVEVASNSSVGFLSGSTVFRSMCLADGKVVDKNALVSFAPAV